MKYVVWAEADVQATGYAKIEADSPEEAEAKIRNCPRLADWEMDESFPPRSQILSVYVDEYVEPSGKGNPYD